MNIQLLIDSIVRQVTVLVAQFATSGGVRAPIAHLRRPGLCGAFQRAERSRRES